MGTWQQAADAGERAADDAIAATLRQQDATPLAAAIARLPDQPDAYVTGFAQHLASHVLTRGAATAPITKPA